MTHSFSARTGTHYITGDQILVQKVGAPEGHWYQGRVHVVRQAEVGLRFHQSFGGSSDTQRYNVRFKLNRIPVKRQHQAMDTVFTQDRVLFPLAVHVPSSYTTGIQPIKVFNLLIGSNKPQLLAVKSVVNQAPGSPPFVVFGPYVLLFFPSFDLLSLFTYLFATDQALAKPSQSLKQSFNSSIPTPKPGSSLAHQATLQPTL